MLRMRMMMLRMMMLVLVGFDDCFLLLYVWAAAFSEASTCCNWIFTRPWLEYLSYIIFQWFIGIVCFVFWTVGVFVMLHFSLSRHCHATSPPSWISGFKSLFSGWDIILELDKASQILLPGMFVKYMQHLFMFYGGQSEQFHLWQWQHRQMTPGIRFRWCQRLIPRRNGRILKSWAKIIFFSLSGDHSKLAFINGSGTIMTFGSTGGKNKRTWWTLCSFLKPQVVPAFRTSKSFHTSRDVDCKKGRLWVKFWAILFYCQTLDTKVMISMMMVLSHDQFPLEIDFSKKITPDRNPSSLSNIWLFQSHVNILERFLHSLRLPVHLCLITRPFQSAKKNSLFVGHLWVRTNLVQFQLRWQKLRYYLVFRHAVAIVCEHVNQKFCFSLTSEL